MVLMMKAVKKLPPSAVTMYPTTTLETVPPMNPPIFFKLKTAPFGTRCTPLLYLARPARSCHPRRVSPVRLPGFRIRVDSVGARGTLTRAQRGIERKGNAFEGGSARRPRAGGGQAHGGARVQARA